MWFLVMHDFSRISQTIKLKTSLRKILQDMIHVEKRGMVLKLHKNVHLYRILLRSVSEIVLSYYNVK